MTTVRPPKPHPKAQWINHDYFGWGWEIVPDTRHDKPFTPPPSAPAAEHVASTSEWRALIEYDQ